MYFLDLWKRHVIYMIMSTTNEVSSFDIISGKISLSPWRTRISQNTLPPPFCFNGECINEAELLMESNGDLWRFSHRIFSWWILFGFIIILTFGFIFLLQCFLKFRCVYHVPLITIITSYSGVIFHRLKTLFGSFFPLLFFSLCTFNIESHPLK